MPEGVVDSVAAQGPLAQARADPAGQEVGHDGDLCGKTIDQPRGGPDTAHCTDSWQRPADATGNGHRSRDRHGRKKTVRFSRTVPESPGVAADYQLSGCFG